MTKCGFVREVGMAREVLGREGCSTLARPTHETTRTTLSLCVTGFMGKLLTLRTMQVQCHIQMRSQPVMAVNKRKALLP